MFKGCVSLEMEFSVFNVSQYSVQVGVLFNESQLMWNVWSEYIVQDYSSQCLCSVQIMNFLGHCSGNVLLKYFFFSYNVRMPTVITLFWVHFF
jgi:uncharacterized alpha/beta hydrolase family protein